MQFEKGAFAGANGVDDRRESIHVDQHAIAARASEQCMALQPTGREGVEQVGHSCVVSFSSSSCSTIAGASRWPPQWSHARMPLFRSNRTGARQLSHFATTGLSENGAAANSRECDPQASRSAPNWLFQNPRAFQSQYDDVRSQSRVAHAAISVEIGIT